MYSRRKYNSANYVQLDYRLYRFTIVTGNSCNVFSKTAFSFVLLERVFEKRFVYDIWYNSFFLSIRASTSVLQNELGCRRLAECIIWRIIYITYAHNVITKGIGDLDARRSHPNDRSTGKGMWNGQPDRFRLTTPIIYVYININLCCTRAGVLYISQ